MKIVKKKLSELHPLEKNVRRHSQTQISEYVRSLEKFEQLRPLVIDENGVIWIGNGMFEAMKAMGWEYAECEVRTGLSENDKKKMMLADNRIYELGIAKDTLANLGNWRSLFIKSYGIATQKHYRTMYEGSINGEWSLLPGINYVLYCFDIDHEKPVFEQFHIFTKEEFLQMWRDLDLVRLNISSAAHKRLRAVYGVDLKFNQAEHADSMAVQVFKTSKKKTKLFEEAFARFPVLTMDALQTICKA